MLLKKQHSISIDTDLWNKARAKAEQGGQSLSAVIRILLRMWLDGEIKI